MKKVLVIALALLALFLPGCQYLYPSLPDERAPLADMEEPLDLFEEPDDEAARRALLKGGFTGVYVREAAESLEDLGDEPGGVVVSRVVENSPGERAGLLPEDVILEVRRNQMAAIELGWPSQWRDIELGTVPGDVLRVIYERAAAEGEASLKVVERFGVPERVKTERFREEEKVGIVVRTATEVEGRAAGLAPGGGAVVVGMSRGSPWRVTGLRFEDMITAVDGKDVAHPQVVLDAIGAAEYGQVLALAVRRGEETLTLDAPVSEREGELRGFTIPLIFSHEDERGTSETSFLFGLLGYKETPAAWEFRLLWLIRFTGGDGDRLEAVEEPER